MQVRRFPIVILIVILILILLVGTPVDRRLDRDELQGTQVYKVTPDYDYENKPPGSAGIPPATETS